MTNRIKFIIKCLTGATFLAPLVLLPQHFVFPFIVGKIFLFRSIVLLMLGTYIVLFLNDPDRYKIRLNPVHIAVILFLVSFTVSSFVGVDWYKSFWDSHERMLGLFTIIHYIIYYFIISTVLSGWKDWHWMFRIFLFLGGIVMVLGIWQKVVDPQAFLNNGNNRVSSTLGNPIYFSGYGLFLFFSGLLSTFLEEKKSWKFYSLLVCFLGFLGIFLGGTRGTLIGLIAGIVAAGVGYFFGLKKNKMVRRSLITVGVLVLVVAGLLFSFRKTNVVNNIPTIGRLLNSSIIEGTGSTRLMAWSIAIDAWKEKPIFGSGPNNFYYSFNKFYNPKFLEYGIGETWFDNAHSALLNTLAVQGVLGFVTYIGLFFSAVLVLWRKTKQGDFLLNIHIISISSGFLIAHFFHNAFVFENPTSFLYFFFFLAFVSSITSKDIAVEKNKKTKNVTLSFVSIVAIIILLLIYTTNVNPARANNRTLDMIRNAYSGGDVTLLYEDMIGIPSPHIDDMRIDFSRTVYRIIPELVKRGRSEEAKKIFELAYNELGKNLDLHPLDIRVHILRSQLAEAVADLTKSVPLLIESEKMLEQALVHSPKRQQIQYMLSIIKLKLQKFDEAIVLLETTINNNEVLGEGWWRLALIYRELGDEEKARSIIEKAVERNVFFDYGIGRQIAEEILPGSTQ